MAELFLGDMAHTFVIFAYIAVICMRGMVTGFVR